MTKRDAARRRSGRLHAADSLDLVEGASRTIDEAKKLVKEIRLGRQRMRVDLETRQPPDARWTLSVMNLESTVTPNHSGRSHAAESLNLYEGASRAIEDTKRLIEQITHQTTPWRDRVK